MRIKSRFHFHPKEVKLTKDIKDKEQKMPHGHFYGKKWFPQDNRKG